MVRKLGERRKAKIRPYVATPAYDGKVDTDYAVSLAESCQAAAACGYEVTTAVMKNGAFIDLARNTFVQLFLETDCTHLFFIDSDLKWESRAFLGLLESGRAVSAGLYRRRQEPESYPVHYVEDEDNPGVCLVDGGWVKCDRVPTGFLCIERKVVEEMAKDALMLKITGQPDTPQLFYTQTLDDGRFMGEDFSWCDDYCERYGEPIWVWPDFDFKHGGYECNWHTYMNKVSDESEKRAANGSN